MSGYLQNIYLSYLAAAWYFEAAGILCRYYNRGWLLWHPLKLTAGNFCARCPLGHCVEHVVSSIAASNPAHCGGRPGVQQGGPLVQAGPICDHPYTASWHRRRGGHCWSVPMISTFSFASMVSVEEAHSVAPAPAPPREQQNAMSSGHYVPRTQGKLKPQQPIQERDVAMNRMTTCCQKLEHLYTN